MGDELELKRSASQYAGITVVLGVAAAAVLLPSAPLPRLAIIGPIFLFVAILGYLGAAVVLFVTWRYGAAPRATVALACSFAATATIMFLALLVLPLMPEDPSVIPASPLFGFCLFVFWHVTAAAGAFWYVRWRRDTSARSPSRRFVISAAATTAVWIGAGVALALAASSHLPGPARMGTDIGKSYATGTAPVVALLLAAAILLVFRLPKANAIDRALGVSLLAVLLDGLLLARARAYGASFYVGRLELMLGASFVLVATLRTLVQARFRLGEVETTLSVVEEESARRAGRIRALWEIASHAADPNDERFSTLLEVATAAMRPGVPMFGTLSHLDGKMVVFDATSWTSSTSAPPGLTTKVFPGAACEIDRMMQRLLFDRGCTLAWDDLSTLYGKGMLIEELGWHSFIGTPVTVGRQTYFVTFGSPVAMTGEPFAADDRAYVDVVASFFASRFTQQQQFARIQFQIEHDALTGLQNRVQFRKAVRDQIRTGDPFAVAFVDLDGFRHVNEREGHQIGDEVLVEVGTALVSVAPRNLVARMSADEFGVLLRGAGGLDAADAALKRYADLFLVPFHTGDRNGTQVLTVGASIGAARFPVDGDTAEELMRRADVALDVAKARGGSTVMIFDNPMESIVAETNLRVVELTDAIARDELALVYQPTFDLATRAIVGAEALVRWDHPERGRLSPAAFVGFAERNGLIEPLTRWVFERLLADLGSTDLPLTFRVYFNVSAQMLDNIPFITEIHDGLRAAPKLVPHLGVEVTETAAMQNVERSMNTIDLFRRWGVSVAIDDFGTGYSSLSYLKQLTVDMIKIDRSFVMGLPDDERDGAIVELLLRITDRFGFATLAEGIESEAQATWLLEHGCRLGQGYLISKPVSFADLLLRLTVPSAV